MSLLTLAQEHIPGLQKKTSREWAGPCPDCGGDDRFVVTQKGDREVFHCRGCEKSGDALAFLRLLGRSCPEAHEELGRRCDSVGCPAEHCRVREGTAGPRPPRPVKALRAPSPASAPEFQPSEPSTPAEKWRVRAAKLIAHAHEQLLSCPEQLAYLARRGLPREAVERYHLGWLAQDAYRPREAWGLAAELRPDGKPKKLWIPAGLVIPFFDHEGVPFRVRVRRSQVEEGRPRYYWVPGSGDDVPVIGREARAFVVVESDLDAFAVHHAAGDLVGAIPLGTVGLKPKVAAAEALGRALAVLVATDCEPRTNEKTGKHENPGGKAAAWWTAHYPRAVRWPVPAGKDPGDYVADHGGDLRAWVLAGLPPVFGVEAPAAPAAAEEAPRTSFAADSVPAYVRGTSRGGIPYVVAETPQLLARAREENPEAVPFLREELRYLKGYTPEALHAVLVAKQAFPEGLIVETKKEEVPCRL